MIWRPFWPYGQKGSKRGPKMGQNGPFWAILGHFGPISALWEAKMAQNGHFGHFGQNGQKCQKGVQKRPILTIFGPGGAKMAKMAKKAQNGPFWPFPAKWPKMALFGPFGTPFWPFLASWRPKSHFQPILAVGGPEIGGPRYGPK